MTQALLNNLNNNVNKNMYDAKVTYSDSNFQKFLDDKITDRTKCNSLKDAKVSKYDSRKNDDNSFKQIDEKVSKYDSRENDDNSFKQTDEKIAAKENELSQETEKIDLTEDTDNTNDENSTVQTDEIITTTITDDEELIMEKEITPLADSTSAIILNQTNLHKNEIEISTDELSLQTNLKTMNVETLQTFNNIDDEPTEVDVKITNPDNHSSKTDKASLQEIISDEIIEDLNIEALESGSANEDAGADFMQNQSPQEYSMKAMIQGDIKFEEINVKTVAANNAAILKEVTPEKIVEQITKQMEGMYNSSRVNIVLNPESLGRLILQLVNSKEGLSAQFTVMTQEARDLIMKGLDGLKESLLAQGINIDNVIVKMSEGADIGDSEQQFKWGEGSRGGNKERGSKHNKENEKPFEQMMFEINQNGNV
ncbi:flagellar hook-length control protein FliK [bacterium]|nr:flagellar hook-length control protein FliK [bacterium]